MKINYAKILNLRKLASDPKKLFVAMIFIFILIFLENFVAVSKNFEAKVTRVIDGDTIEVLSKNNQRDRIRLYGIDAPESKQAYGQKSRKFLSSIIAGKNVKIIYKDKDQYGRILAIVEFQGRDINKIMVQQGFAWAYSYYSDLYILDQKTAKERKIGLWRDKNPIEPYKWRKQHRF